MARGKGPRKIYRNDNEFKVKAVRLSQLPEVQVGDISESFVIHPFMLSKWHKLQRDGKLSSTVEMIIDPQCSGLQVCKRTSK